MINVHEIFYSISGEVGAVPQGTPMLFVRLAGCNLNCHYCDTKESKSFAMGEKHNIEPLAETIAAYGIRNVMFTGGEPLLQQFELSKLIDIIEYETECLTQYHIETNGTIRPIADIYLRCNMVYDYKIDQDSEMINPSYMYRGKGLQSTIKIVVGNQQELKKAVEVLNVIHEFCDPSQLAIGTYDPENFPASKIFNYFKEINETKIILNTQIHKYLGLD